jgi:hypothetical protein
MLRKNLLSLGPRSVFRATLFIALPYVNIAELPTAIPGLRKNIVRGAV